MLPGVTSLWGADSAVTRDAAGRVSEKRGFLAWHDPEYMGRVIERMQAAGVRLRLPALHWV